MSHGSLVAKPETGHWTDAYPELGRGPVSPHRTILAREEPLQ